MKSVTNLFTAAIAIVIAMIAGQAAASTMVLKSKGNNRYVAAIGSSSGLMGAAGNKSTAAKFEVINLGNNRLAFKLRSTGKYLRAGVGSKTQLMAASPHVRGWETFERINYTVGGQGFVALRSVQNGKFVTIRGGGSANYLSATATGVSSNEMFRIEAASASQSASAPRTSGDWYVTHIRRNNRLIVIKREWRQETDIRIRRGSISGTAGCNQFNSDFTQRGVAVAVTNLIGTKRACRQVLMSVERAVHNGLESAAFVRANNPRELIFLDANGAPLLQLGR